PTLDALVRRLGHARAIPDGARPLPRADPGRPPPGETPPPPSSPPPPLAPPTAAPSADLEQWFGQRGLLVIGVVALLAAAAFFLKYAFDRGWIPPLVRSLLAVAAGIGVAVWGEDRIRHGMRRYGAAMIGAGGGLVYLGLWAAAGPYALLDRRAGVVLPPPVPNPDLLLGYLEVIGLGTGILAFAMGWRCAFDVALFGYLFLAAAGAATALRSPLGCWLIASAALLTLHSTRRRYWPEARLGIVVVSWALLGASLGGIHGAEARTWLALGAAAAVSGLLWWPQLAR